MKKLGYWIGYYSLKLLFWAFSILMIPFIPFFWVMCRLEAKQCPKCGERWLTELTGEWDGEDWHCMRCNHYWTIYNN